MKIISIINWVLLGINGICVLWALVQPANAANDAGGSQQEVAIKALAVFVLLVLIGLNWLPYGWTKILVLILASLCLLLVWQIAVN